MKGTKHDAEKVRFDLRPAREDEQVAWVETFGAVKYDDDNWQHVPNAQRRYFSAIRRHLNAWKQGQITDGEFGLPHLAHAICCLYYLMWLDNEEASVIPMPTPLQAASIVTEILAEKAEREAARAPRAAAIEERG